ncbi:MAG: hypothetical protein ACN4GW_20100 [Desulforhopalus sp.]
MADEKDRESFVDTCSVFNGRPDIEGIEEPLNATREKIRDSGVKYLFAIQKAAEIYHHIKSVKGKDTFITEKSMDETEEPQTPEELLFILAALGTRRFPPEPLPPNLPALQQARTSRLEQGRVDFPYIFN